MKRNQIKEVTLLSPPGKKGDQMLDRLSIINVVYSELSFNPKNNPATDSTTFNRTWVKKRGKEVIMKTKIKKIVKSSILLVVAMLLLSGCDKDYLTAPARTSKPCLNCMKLKINGNEVVTVDKEKITGYLKVRENKITGPVYVEFYDSNANRLETENGKYKLEWTVENESYARLEPYRDLGETAFSVEGKKVGDTHVKFQLSNSGENEIQPEFQSPNILIKVLKDDNN